MLSIKCNLMQENCFKYIFHNIFTSILNKAKSTFEKKYSDPCNRNTTQV